MPIFEDYKELSLSELSGYEPPPFALLDVLERQKIAIDEESLKNCSMLLERKLKEFDIQGRITAIHPGPVVTMYEFQPIEGVKLNKIVDLQDDLSLVMGGINLRIIPYLPGSAAVGIEIPNDEREIVWLRDIVSSQQFTRITTKLPLVLGASTAGYPVIVDLAEMPHVLIVGASESGKSVAINSIIISILYRSSPADVRMILIDPKMVELSCYDGIPHLLLPVITKPGPAVQALRWAIREMERRYWLMADTSTKNILDYNQKIENGQVDIKTIEQLNEILEQNPNAAIHTGKLPYIAIVIDEIASIVTTEGQSMSDAITLLVRMANDAGIHLIITMRQLNLPVVNELLNEGLFAQMILKGNYDSVESASRFDSMRLLGLGDMFFMTPTSGDLIRVHGSYVTDSDIARVIAHVKQQGEPVYDESVFFEQESDGEGVEFEGENDELYDKAVKLVVEARQASISIVQRRLRIGYNRAARMIERMENDGIIGPANGDKPRQVLVNL